VLPTVKALKRLRFKMAICTSSDQEKLSVSMRVAGLTDGMFDFIISGDRVKRKKPFPDIYLCGAESLGLPTERCAVVEDAVTGIKAAKTAGCYAVGITTSFTERELFSAGADRVIADIGELLKPDGTVI
jgi:HAD superfamily hydrolase (TIGR01509 family)